MRSKSKFPFCLINSALSPSACSNWRFKASISAFKVSISLAVASSIAGASGGVSGASVSVPPVGAFSKRAGASSVPY